MRKYRITKTSPTLTKKQIQVVGFFHMMMLIHTAFIDETITVEKW